jgi:hypothetical protein
MGDSLPEPMVIEHNFLNFLDGDLLRLWDEKPGKEDC